MPQLCIEKVTIEYTQVSPDKIVKGDVILYGSNLYKVTLALPHYLSGDDSFDGYNLTVQSQEYKQVLFFRPDELVNKLYF